MIYVRLKQINPHALPEYYQILFKRLLDYELAITDNGKFYCPEFDNYFSPTKIKLDLIADFDGKYSNDEVDIFIRNILKGGVAAIKDHKNKGKLCRHR